MNLLRNNISIVYIFLLAVQVALSAQYFAYSLPISIPDYVYFESVATYFNDHKRVELIAYMVGVMTIGLYFIAVLIIEKKMSKKARWYCLATFSTLNNLKNQKLLVISGVLYIIFPIAVYHLSTPFIIKFLLQIIGLIGSSVFPFWGYLSRYKSKKIKLAQISYLKLKNIMSNKSFYIIFLGFGFLHLGYLFFNPIVHQPKIINEYMNIPEQTILKNGYLVNNQQYLKKLLLGESSLQDAGKKDQFELHGNAVDLEKLDINEYVSKDWLKKNSFELHWQVLSRYMIHHNSFMFIPIGDFELGKKWGDINAQYGLGSAWLFEKLLAWQNSISLDGWLKLSYGFYYIYFVFFVAIVFSITRSLSWTTLIFLLSLALVNNRGYDFLLLPPGESPWRHIFDIVILYLLFLFAEQKKLFFYITALLFGVLSIALSPQIGIMIFLATIVSGIFYALREKFHVWPVVISSTVSVVVAGYCFILSSSANDLAQYYLDGVIGFPIKFHQMFKIFLMIIIGYIFLWKILKERLSLNYVYLVFLVIYAQELILYVVWHYNGDGFKSRAFIYVLTIALLLFPFQKIVADRWKNILLIFSTVAIGVFYITSVIRVNQSKNLYEQIFKQHISYEWKIDRAHIISTMNPVYFQNGVDLIQKYSNGRNGIYMISEYDNFLPFLAHKYSLMPFFDLKWYLVTPRELNKSIQTIKDAKPEYLFVDTGIGRDLNNEIIDVTLPEIGYLHQESIWRVERLRLLNKIFESVAPNYELVEKSYLISVYKRKDLE
ncbi:MAG: hypothetical protein AB7S65_11720 [Sulfuricurvum sp.]